MFNSWGSFWNWLDNANVGGMILSFLCPGLIIMLHNRYEHRKTRKHAHSPEQANKVQDSDSET